MSTNTELSFNECVELIVNAPTSMSFIVEGDTGIGKSSLGTVIAARKAAMTGIPHDVVMFDCTIAEPGDTCIPLPQDVRGQTQIVYTPNSMFGVGKPNPQVIVLDELGKSSTPVINGSLPLLLDHRVGPFFIPEGSVVLGTTNLAGEGLGDKIPPHARNRLTAVTMRKPTKDEWVRYAGAKTDIDPAVIGFVTQFPTVFQSYKESGAESNSYIYNPKAPNRAAFATPRSLERAGWLLSKRHTMSNPVWFAALQGTVGGAAARDLLTMITLADQLPSHEAALADPTGCKVPAAGVAQLMMGLNLIRVTTGKQVDAMVTYMRRMQNEIQAVVLGSLFDNPQNAFHFMTSKEYMAWNATMSKYFGKV